ncbi:uncharacterized protein AKAME5_002249900 [Lates japonicus]|uniref:Uncharacterized protein n=1 Tax=Lates japonicus TaxID=270547 RepID=A0AAD3RJ84_LATJO|nr:uncharacterized protein AKAME5_002249900 [Lates japonicus]
MRDLALVISMIMEIAIKSAAQTTDSPYSIIRRVFVVKRKLHLSGAQCQSTWDVIAFVTNEQRLREELRRLETQLSGHLTILKNSLMLDGQMNTRGFNIWVNGASFHVQMLIHEARLNIQAGQPASRYVDQIKAAITSVGRRTFALESHISSVKTWALDTHKKIMTDFLLAWYEASLQSQCVLPDVGIDESLLKYSGLNSNTELQVYSNGLLTSVPGYITRLGSILGAVTSLPNAVGLGALVISMIMEIAIKSTAQTTDHSYSIIRRVFGEEKASSVRDTMSEYLRRHRVFVTNEQRLREELRRLETQLSGHLTILKNSLMLDGQMSSRGFKIWVNGASFHVQMLIHEARLNIQTGQPASRYINQIKAAITVYEQELDDLLKKYKDYKSNVGIDESLLKYSGLNSNTELQAYSNELLTSVPGYMPSKT